MMFKIGEKKLKFHTIPPLNFETMYFFLFEDLGILQMSKSRLIQVEERGSHNMQATIYFTRKTHQ